MRILVFSDTHKDILPCIETVDRLIGVDMILHAGDHADDAKELEYIFPDIPIRYVAGNCDFTSAPQELIVEACGKKIFVTHGHNFRVKSEEKYTSLYEYAESKGCDCAVFGHTHKGVNDCSRNVILLNPGSVKHCRTFGVIEIENGVLKTAICEM